MLSRVAENIYWMARYIERSENTARIINANVHLQLDLPKDARFGWQPLIDITGTNKTFSQHYEDASERNVIRFLVRDVANPVSIFSSLTAARENARTIREIIPSEAWEQVNELHQFALSRANDALTQRKRYDYLRLIILNSQTITGLLAGTMTHDYGYSFLRMGRNLERADMTTRIIDVRSVKQPELAENLAPYENIQWMSILQSLTAYQMYRRSVNQPVKRSAVIRFLFTHTQFPRSFNHCMGEVQSCLQELPGNDEVLKTLAALRGVVTNEDYAKLKQKRMHKFIDDLQVGLGELHTAISAKYFRH